MLRKLLITFAIVNFGNIQTDVTIFIFASNNNIKMGRKGDINTRAIATRVPTELFVKLTMKAVENQQTMSALVSDILSRADAPAKASAKSQVVEKIVYQNEPEMVDELKKAKESLQSYFSMWQEAVTQVENWEREAEDLHSLLAQKDNEIKALKSELHKTTTEYKKEQEKRLKQQELEQYKKQQRANTSFVDKEGNIRWYDKDGNESK